MLYLKLVSLELRAQHVLKPNLLDPEVGEELQTVINGSAAAIRSPKALARSNVQYSKFQFVKI